MRGLHRSALALMGVVGMAAASLHGSDGGICLHCEEIREDNKVNHKNYEYYEDYLKDQQKGEQKEKQTVAMYVDPLPDHPKQSTNTPPDKPRKPPRDRKKQQ